MANLIQTVLGAVSPDAAARLSASLGETPAATDKGLSAAAPALLAGALQQGATPAGAGDLLGLVDRATADGDPLSRSDQVLTDPATEAPGQAMAAGLLGDRTASVASGLAGFGGISGNSATRLLALAAPLVLGALGRAMGPDRTAGTLTSVLTGERSAILSALPPQLGSLFGLAGAAVTPPAATAPVDAPAQPGALGRWAPWMVAALLLIAFFLGIRSCGDIGPRAPPPQASAP